MHNISYMKGSNIMKPVYWWFLGGVIVGVVASPVIRSKIPGASKLPTV